MCRIMAPYCINTTFSKYPNSEGGFTSVGKTLPLNGCEALLSANFYPTSLLHMAPLLISEIGL